jgi:histidine phosphotransferase ChpT
LSTATSSGPVDAAASVVDLGALVGSRICHDLISPLGAIGNGVELIALSGQGPTPEMSLIAESVENANARIRFFRVAFGAAAAEQAVGAQEILAIVEGLSRTGRHRIDWTAGGAARLEVKLAFLLVLCVAAALPWGGTIEVRRAGAGWEVVGTAGKTRIDRDLWAALSDPRQPLSVSSAEVEFPLAREAALRIGAALGVGIDTGRIAVTF